MIATLHPLYSIIWGIVLLHEVPSGRLVVGGIVILGVVVSETMTHIKWGAIFRRYNQGVVSKRYRYSKGR